MNTHFISAEHLTIDHVGEIMTHDYRPTLSDDARTRIVRCREYLDRKIEATERPIYGVTTGFGSLCNVSVQPDELSQLQINLDDVARLRHGRPCAERHCAPHAAA